MQLTVAFALDCDYIAETKKGVSLPIRERCCRRL